MAATATPRPPYSHYAPRGGAVSLFNSRAPEVLLSGPAGTGKSLCCLWKLHFLCSKVAGVRALVCRKTRASLTESGLVTLEKGVFHPRDQILIGPTRAHRQSYRYPNGSEIVVGGLDNAARIMSTEFDLVYVQEATELAEGDWEALTTRLRNGRLAWQQLLADCNPDSPRHWLKRRCDAGRCQLHESRHEDNPRLWDGSQWTPEGLDYLAKLDALTGPRHHRLRHGRWVQAEGVVYESFDPARHIIDRFAVPEQWPRVLAVDFGYTNPLVMQWWAVDPDGRMYLYREIYRTRFLVEDAARLALDLSANEPAPAAVVCDHDAEGRATLERHTGWDTTPADKRVRAGIQAVQARLRDAGDGRPRVFFARDALVERDPLLHEAKRPCCTVEEFDCYVWSQRGNKDEPVKENDHGQDAMRYVALGLEEPALDTEEEVYRP